MVSGQDMLTLALAQLRAMTLLEIGGVLSGLLCVWLTVRENIWCWLTGSVSNVLFAVLFIQSRLYADFGLQLIYIALNAYGWYEWLHGGQNRTALPVRVTPARLRLPFAAITLAGTALLAGALRAFTNSDVPVWDASTTALSLMAQYMLARKYIENWWVWIGANALYTVLYVAKGLYLTSALQLVFITLSVMGYLEWRKQLSAARATVAVPAPTRPAD